MIRKNIILVGFMGCGKSTIGRGLSAGLKYEFLDTDIKIQNDMGMSISSIFQEYSESYFRKLERNLCKMVALNAPMIVATGGGIIKEVTNIDTLKIGGVIIYLKNTAQKIYKNIKYDTSRPLLNVENKEAKIKELLEQRIPLYEKCADITVDVSELKIDESINLIINIINNLEKNENEKSQNN